MSQASKIDNMPFEQAMAELEDIVRKLESGEAPLEQAIELYEQGNVLQTRCEKLLQNAQLKVEEVYKSKDGKTTTKPSELENLF